MQYAVAAVHAQFCGNVHDVCDHRGAPDVQPLAYAQQGEPWGMQQPAEHLVFAIAEFLEQLAGGWGRGFGHAVRIVQVGFHIGVAVDASGEQVVEGR